MRNSARFIPSLFTVLNLFCGFLSIINATNNNLEQACLFIIYASLFDAFDGVVARFTGTSSKFGVELDSLSDVVSFGVAPSFIMYRFYFYQMDGPGIAIASLVMIFTSLRLARFNAQLVGFDKNYFSGVPAPLSALTLIAFFLFYFNKNFSPQLSEIFIYILAFLLPALMVSKFKYDTLPKFSIRELKAHPVKSIIILLIIIMIIVTKGDGLFAFCLFYLSTGIFRALKNFVRRLFRPAHADTEEEMKVKTTNL
ncbi:MAG: CDP-diacylglycerol--serine O-phosphatidyltransferase [Ignavibacteriae bacterium]|nr:MAG: CDP-diacylglycerol--serine O-phosphatidyltransferase [Ignavibacteriota bacterium]